jgi:gas vesicle protein GvpO
MADLSESQRKRRQARERRRKGPDESNANDGAEHASQDDEQLQHAVRQAAKGAVAAAAVGAAAAAARKLASRDDADQPEQQQPEPEPEREQQEAQAEEAEPQREPDREPVAGAGVSEARRVLDRGREQLEDLLGRPVESVSSLERTHDGWVLSLEVVEVKRIPETTDILASYELELDDDLNLRRYQQARRYHRARADDRDDQ